MTKRLKEVLTMLGVVAILISIVVLAAIEMFNTGTISGITLAPVLVGLIWFVAKMVANDIKSFKEAYDMADDE